VVATDVAARGIHVDDVGLVVHFDAAGDAKSYLHRSGRTARAGRDGCVVTLSTPRAVPQVVRLQQNAGVEVLHHDLRTAPRPMTAEALAEAGHPGPVSTHDSQRRPGRPGLRKPHRGQGRRPAGSSYAGRKQRPGKSQATFG
jgi:superfamily II DNA/RNA helicase